MNFLVKKQVLKNLEAYRPIRPLKRTVMDWIKSKVSPDQNQEIEREDARYVYNKGFLLVEDWVQEIDQKQNLMETEVKALLTFGYNVMDDAIFSTREMYVDAQSGGMMGAGIEGFYQGQVDIVRTVVKNKKAVQVINEVAKISMRGDEDVSLIDGKSEGPIMQKDFFKAVLPDAVSVILRRDNAIEKYTNSKEHADLVKTILRAKEQSEKAAPVQPAVIPAWENMSKVFMENATSSPVNPVPVSLPKGVDLTLRGPMRTIGRSHDD